MSECIWPKSGEEEEGGGVLFQKLEKSAPILGKDALIVVNYELNFSFEMQFLRVSR